MTFYSRTLDFLRNVRQDQYKLPEGPLLLNSELVLNSFRNEVVQREPHKFKAVLLDNI